MSRTAVIASALLALMAFIPPGFASNNYTIDLEHVTVSFTVRHSIWAKYQGMVRKIAGTIIFDKEHIENSSVQVEMDAMSVDTLDVNRDNELQGYPVIIDCLSFNRASLAVRPERAEAREQVNRKRIREQLPPDRERSKA
ncbi:MAG: YceI family protein [Aestuariivirga sp.]